MAGLRKFRASLIAICALALALNLAPATSAALAGQPTDDIKNLIDEVLTILKNPTLNIPAQKSQRLDLIEKAAARRFDYQEMARRSLESHWDKLTKAEQNEFVNLFTALLKSSYAHRVDEIANAKVAYESEKITGDTAEVRAVIQRPNDRIPVDFRLLRRSDGWKICDLVIENVSLAKNLNHQFGCVIEGSSYKELVRCLRGKLKEEKGN
jgi:phospholipid transport system substrate-binding protein